MIFTGKRDGRGEVTVRVFPDLDSFQAGIGGADLPLRLDLRNHSPTGFEWGYAGSGPAQLALAICSKVVGDERALKVYQSVKDQLFTPLDKDEWSLTSQLVGSMILGIESEGG